MRLFLFGFFVFWGLTVLFFMSGCCCNQNGIPSIEQFEQQSARRYNGDEKNHISANRLEYQDWFSYDRSSNLDIHQNNITEANGCRIIDLDYAGAGGGRVSAYLILPEGNGPYAGILYLHREQCNRDEFLGEARRMALCGAVSLLIDAPYCQQVSSIAGSREPIVQTVIDLRRGIDLLCARREVEISRIGFVGQGFGATWGSILAGVESRIQAYVLAGGGYYPVKAGGPNNLREVVEKIGFGSSVALFFQFNRSENYPSKESALAFFRLAGEPKLIQWYNSGPGLKPRLTGDRVKWLQAQLSLTKEELNDQL